MKTAVVSFPDNSEDFFLALMKKLRLKAHVLSEDELENKVLSKWISEGMKTEDVPMEKIFALLEKRGAERLLK